VKPPWRGRGGRGSRPGLLAAAAVAVALVRESPEGHTREHPAPGSDASAPVTTLEYLRGTETDSPPNGESAAPEPDSVSTRWIGARVVDAEGRALEGAWVYRVGADQPWLAGGGEHNVVESDSEGRWRLDVYESGVADLGAFKLGFAPVLIRDVWFDARESRDGIEITLGAGAAITGRVLDARGDPVEGLCVMAWVGERPRHPSCHFGPAPGRLRLEESPIGARTDAAGEYAFRGLRAGVEYRVALAWNDREWESCAPCLETPVTAPAAGVDFVRPARLSVRAIDAQDGSRLRSWNLAIVDEEGRSARCREYLPLFLLPGTYLLKASAQHYASAAASVDIVSTHDEAEIVIELRRLETGEFGSLRVTAVDEMGAPVPVFNVSVDRDWSSLAFGNVRRSPDDEDPLNPLPAEIDGIEPGRCSLAVWPHNYPWLRSTRIETEILPGETTNLEVVIAVAGRIVLRVNGASGEAITGYRITLTRKTGGESQRILEDYEVEVSGLFNFDELLPGTYLLEVHCPGFETHRESVDVEALEDAFVEVILFRTG
jgi:hypothetical protein